jgi:hypothetical protein
MLTPNNETIEAINAAERGETAQTTLETLIDDLAHDEKDDETLELLMLAYPYVVEAIDCEVDRQFGKERTQKLAKRMREVIERSDVSGL